MRENDLNPDENYEDRAYELSLRPRLLKEFIGQDQMKLNLAVFMKAAQQRGEPLDHVLLYGPPGLGKTTLAHIIAGEMKATIHVTSGPAIERPGDLVGILTASIWSARAGPIRGSTPRVRWCTRTWTPRSIRWRSSER